MRKALDIQWNRYEHENYHFNAELNPNGIKTYCKLGGKEEKLIKSLFEKLQLSTRAYHRMIKVARTIADLEGSETISCRHISEAVCYRSLDQKYWGG